MNRLVLIGNGYDLAAGLNTSYEGFLVDYFKTGVQKVATSIIKNGEPIKFDDSICIIEGYFDKLNKGIFTSKLNRIKTIEDLIRPDMIRFTHLHSEKEWKEAKGVTTVGPGNRFDIRIKSNFLLQLLGDFNWKDIEGFYFEKLKRIYELEKYAIKNEKSDLSEKIKRIREERLIPLNEEFYQLKLVVIEYLCAIEIKKIKSFKFLEHLKKPLEQSIFNNHFNKGSFKTEPTVEAVKFVNFNYTDTLEDCFEKGGLKNKYSRKDLIYIHGNKFSKEDIIFGYGDDTDLIFKELELTGENEYLKHLKSFHYPLNKEYIELMNYTEVDQFEVVVAGHSLGLSDRVLLKSIFEHDNCKRIRILYKKRSNGKQWIQSRYMALARHFDNKMIMRNKIATFNEEDELD